MYNSLIVLLFFLLFSRFQVKKKQFFRNFITITLFGAVGTLISFTVISLGKFAPKFHFYHDYQSLVFCLP